MRIIAGKYKGRVIKTLKLATVRPTQDKVREALFDILAGDIADAAFLELYAGYGGVGLEALSRGAEKVVFIEKDKRCCNIIKSNLEAIGESENCPVFAKDSLEAVGVLAKKGIKFNIIFADPPYYKGLPKKCLQKLSGCDIVLPYGFVVIQSYKKDALPECEGRLKLKSSRFYGDSILNIYNAI